MGVVKNLMIRAGADFSDLQRELQSAQKSMKKAGKKMTSIGKSMTQNITAPVIGFGAAATKVGIDFESAMSEVKAISGASEKDMEMLENAAKEMGKATSKSATEAAEALKYMSLAGWDATTSAQALEPVLRLSEAGNLDLARTSDLVTDSMSSLGIAVADLPQYLDQVAQTSRKSNTDIDALMEAMVIAGGTFKNLNAPLDEANALLGVLANRGVKGAEAGNAMNSIMVNLTTGAGKAGKAMEELNISAFDSEGKFKGMAEVLKEVKDKTAAMTEEQRNNYLAMIGGKTQLDTLQKLLSGVGEEYGALRGNIGASTGALNDMAKTMQDNLKGRLTVIKSKLEGVCIQLSEILIPMIEKVVEKIGKWVDWFSNLDKSTQEIIVKIALVAAAIGPLLMIMGSMMTSMSALCNAGNTLSTIFGGLSGAANMFKAGLTFLTGPTGMVILGITALIAVGVLLYKNWDTIKEKAGQLGEYLKAVFESFGLKITNTINGIKSKFWEMIDKILEKVEPFVKFLPESWQEAFNDMKASTDDNLTAIDMKMADTTARIEENSRRVSTALNQMSGSYSKAVDAAELSGKRYAAQAEAYLKNKTVEAAEIAGLRYQGMADEIVGSNEAIIESQNETENSSNEYFENLQDGAKKTTTSFQDMSDAIAKTMDDLNKKMQSLYSSRRSALDNISSKLKDGSITKSTAQWLAKDLFSQTTEVPEWISNPTNGVDDPRIAEYKKQSIIEQVNINVKTPAEAIKEIEILDKQLAVDVG